MRAMWTRIGPKRPQENAALTAPTVALIEQNGGSQSAHLARAVCGREPTRLEKPKLLELVHEAIQARHYSPRTEKTYVSWVRRFILFHDKRHPGEMGEAEINAFLSHLGVKGRVSASTQNQALGAILFLYRHVL